MEFQLETFANLYPQRDYEITQAEITVADQKTNSQLDDRLKLMVAQGRPEGVELYSLSGPLTSHEVDLLRAPGPKTAAEFRSAPCSEFRARKSSAP